MIDIVYSVNWYINSIDILNSIVFNILVDVNVDDSVNKHNVRIVSLYSIISSCIIILLKEDIMSNQHLYILLLLYYILYY